MLRRDHPRYGDLEAAIDRLRAAEAALESGAGSTREVVLARVLMYKIASEIEAD